MATQAIRRSSSQLRRWPSALVDSSCPGAAAYGRQVQRRSWSSVIGSRAKKGAASSRGTAHGKMGLQGLARLRHREHQLLRPATWGSSQVAGSWRSFGASATARADGHQYTISDLSAEDYHDVSDLTLDTLTEALEELVGSGTAEVEGWDVEYSSGVMTFSMAAHGTYVINKQPPNKQIWLSSPFSGPKRYDYDASAKVWFYTRDGTRMKDLLEKELSETLGRPHELAIEEGDP